MDLLLDMETGSAMASGLGKFIRISDNMLPPQNEDNFIVKIMSKLYYVISEQKSLDYFTISDIFLLFSCVDLLQEIQLRVKPQYHIFGHIHEGK